MRPINGEEENRDSWPRLLTLLALAVGFTIFATAMMVDSIRMYRTEWATTQGQAVEGEIRSVLSSSAKSGGKSTSYEPVVTAEYQVAGVDYRRALVNFERNHDRSVIEKRLKEILDQRVIPIAYNVADPSEAYFEEAPTRINLGVAIIFSQVALGFTAWGIYRLRRRLRWQKQARS